ncbi:hypothetical protein J0H58_00950 [bacterium]|nr:hypothetical protein [bacterium]
MTPEAQRVAALIRGVTLGEGVGLLQGQGLDDYALPAKLAEYRAKDEKDDWSRIPPVILDQCNSSLSFFDAEGMRFHLPAYLLADLEEKTQAADVVFTLTYKGIGGAEVFELLSEPQREAVRQFLLLKLAEMTGWEGETPASPMIRAALNSVWATSSG